MRHLDAEESRWVEVMTADRAAVTEAQLVLRDAEYALKGPACWSWGGVPSVSQEVDDAGARQMLRDWQEERCAVCGRRDPGLLEDHDHATGMVRGYLCHSCNVREGLNQGEDSLFAQYRDRNPASMSGALIRYWSPFTGYADPQQPVTYADDYSDHPSFVVMAAMERLLKEPGDAA